MPRVPYLLHGKRHLYNKPISLSRYCFLLFLSYSSLKFCDSNGKELQFKLKKGTYSTLLWKLTVRIYCQKVTSSLHIYVLQLIDMN